jgi:hypothetical protein
MEREPNREGDGAMMKLLNNFLILAAGFGAGLTFGPHENLGFWIWLVASVAFFALSLTEKYHKANNP